LRDVIAFGSALRNLLMVHAVSVQSSPAAALAVQRVWKSGNRVALPGYESSRRDVHPG